MTDFDFDAPIDPNVPLYQLLDTGWTIQLFREPTGYVACAIPPRAQAILNEIVDDDPDIFGMDEDSDIGLEFEAIMGDGSRYRATAATPLDAIKNLAEKCLLGK